MSLMEHTPWLLAYGRYHTVAPAEQLGPSSRATDLEVKSLIKLTKVLGLKQQVHFCFTTRRDNPSEFYQPEYINGYAHSKRCNPHDTCAWHILLFIYSTLI